MFIFEGSQVKLEPKCDATAAATSLSACVCVFVDVCDWLRLRRGCIMAKPLTKLWLATLQVLFARTVLTCNTYASTLTHTRKHTHSELERAPITDKHKYTHTWAPVKEKQGER